MIKMNMILKRNTTDEENPRYNVGWFKVVPNKIGLINIINTSDPENVEDDLDDLLNEYHNLKSVSIEEIIDFHYRFERIRPFGDEDEPLEQKATYIQKCLQNKGFTENSKSFFTKIVTIQTWLRKKKSNY